MYHDTIHIRFKYDNWKDVSFSYSFFISKNLSSNTEPIKYGDLLQEYKELGFNIKYLKFNDIGENSIVYCSYNHQPNINVFFLAYRKLIRNKDFDINFEYGNIINNIFIPNNMNFFAGIYFLSANKPNVFKSSLTHIDYLENVIEGKKHLKIEERYQLIDIDGNIIHKEITNAELEFEQHFFEKYEVKIALRKYKLGRLENLFK